MSQTAIIGAGVMGETLLSGLVRAGRRVDHLLVGEKRSERARELEERYGVAEALMASVGKVLRIPERQQDAVTAISGSGPAYIFFVVESMIEAGVHLGLPRSTAT